MLKAPSTRPSPKPGGKWDYERVKVTIVRGGGIAGIATTTRLRSSDLSPPEAGELERRVREAGLLEAGAGSPVVAPSHPDDLLYSIAVEEGGEERTARFTDSGMPPAVRSLVEWIDSIASA